MPFSPKNLSHISVYCFLIGSVLLLNGCGGNPSYVDEPESNEYQPITDTQAYSQDAGTTPPEGPYGNNCSPSCSNKECGSDGCGELCGQCPSGYQCNPLQQCVKGCTPNCTGKACGSDGCGSQCGKCAPNQECSDQGMCLNTGSSCKANCTGKQCGPDGCGGKCGICNSGLECNGMGKCLAASCLPSCFGKQCGADGCGGHCGKCAPGQVCDGTFKCQEPANGCGDLPSTGQCTGSTLKWCFNGKIYSKNCDANVGLICGWNANEQKNACIPGGCVPSCNNKDCGPDGCGGKCGICPGGQSCTAAQQCSAGCIAQCNGKLCGSNGCGGSCGSCPQGQVCASNNQCKDGLCVANCVGKSCGPDGCGGKCGICPSGHSCSGGGQCQVGGCSPDCSGKQCGDNGCGGSCGNCPGGLACGPGFKCSNQPCVPSCNGVQCGPDGCGGYCGICPDGESCNAGGNCQVGACTPNCTDAQCGADGCGGKCGLCPNSQFCNEAALCQNSDGCVADCAGKDCGSDGCGNQCGQCEPGLSCSENFLCVGLESNDTSCGDISFEGACEDDTLKYCSSNALVVVDCGEQAMTCTYSNDNQWFECNTPENTGDKCGDITWKGVCDGSKLKYCSSDQLVVKDCSVDEKYCAYDDQFQWNDCLDTPGSCTPDCQNKSCGSDGCGGYCGECAETQLCENGSCTNNSGCGDINSSGTCIGDVLKYCAGDSLTTVNCADSAQSCAWDDQFQWFNCVNNCTPECGGQVCGPDGCGGSCGECPNGNLCTEGQCSAQGNCGNVTWMGACAGNTLEFCTAGELETKDCAGLGMQCGYDETLKWFDCTNTPGVCVPDCSDKVCGSDGCGSSCGDCANGELCGEGQCATAGNDCGELTLKGECLDGDTLVYCANNALITVECEPYGKVCAFEQQFEWFSCVEECTPSCDGKLCGDNGCGGTCGSCEEGQDCQAGQCINPDDCGDISWTGVCEGSTLKYCAGNTLQQKDCSSTNQECGYSEQFNWYDCTDTSGVCVPQCSDKSCGSDGCGSTCGDCLSNQNCQNGQCQTVQNNECGDIGVAGQCQENNTLLYCAGGKLGILNCGDSNKVCAFEEQFQWYNCINECTPVCAGNQCGDDGCGGSCGECAFGESCQSGQCALGNGCGNVGLKGKCEGQTLKYCSADNLQIFDCAEFGKNCAYVPEKDWYDCVETQGECVPGCTSMVCGDDGCGGSCGTCGIGAICNLGQCTEADGCGDVDSKGACENNVLKYCAGGTLKSYECTQYDKTCGFDTDNNWYDCIEDNSSCVPKCESSICGDDGCGGSCGSCAAGLSCSGGQCVNSGGCGSVTFEGVCEDNGKTLKWCQDDSLQTLNCSDFGGVCQYDIEKEYYNCKYN